MDMNEYLGDGVYAIYDGRGIWLHANDLNNPTDKVFLEGETIGALNNFVEKIQRINEENKS